VFLDGHCRPEAWALERLVNDVEDTGGRFIITPAITNLDPSSWEFMFSQVGFGYRIVLENIDCGWLGTESMRRRGKYYETPAFCGCSIAMSRDLYEKLRGFDPNMVDWGVEDLDLALKAWLLGDGVLHDPDAWIGHRFRERFDTFTVDSVAVPVNQLRTARKNFTDPVWDEWVGRFRARESPEGWEGIWRRFAKGRRSAEKEREYLLANRKRDEYWYAARFGLNWPLPR